MAPSASFAPKHSCSNFPLCTDSQTKNRNLDGTRTRISRCALCSARPRCAFQDCENHAAPSEGHYRTDFCSMHYRDPCNALLRKWRLCSNSRICCSQLAQEPRSGTCYACNNGCPLCAHSMSGCPSHVRNPAKLSLRLRNTCSSHDHRRCPFDGSNSLSCSTSMCGRPRVSALGAHCLDCMDGHMPCSQNCSRRTLTISDKLCPQCSRQTSQTTAVLAVTPTPVSHIASDHGSTASGAAPAFSDNDRAPQKSLTPPYACFNFPICSKSQRQIMTPRSQGSRTVSHRSPYCTTCELCIAQARCCLHPSCTHPIAPPTKGRTPHDFCRLHMEDPGHASVREWPLCRNSEDTVFCCALDRPSWTLLIMGMCVFYIIP